ncbi:Stability protein StbD (plasmid) [Legionella adelaidensis]|uniref:Antitoxin n=1 Tax=Legionella adelaidensis TaxID=45056 RepID=A0A0W0R3T3_9GAMM|nr:type II toxin-antitoxin system prevent-host-death family antitoxin [Legionella adelaidensis]KTC65690.1 Antitoxin YafN [Legionella adelaidensis]VEH85972.1 Stability protein StbD [Legionella adelaidensis]
MERVLVSSVASISELKKNPTKLINGAHGHPVAILNHNSPAAYLVPAETFKKIMALLEEQGDDLLLASIVKNRLSKKFTPIEVSLDDL